MTGFATARGRVYFVLALVAAFRADIWCPWVVSR